MREKIVGDMIFNIPETFWERLKDKQSRQWIIKDTSLFVSDYLIDHLSMIKAYFKYIGKSFMYFLKSFIRKPQVFRDYIPCKSIRLCRVRVVPVPKTSPGPIDHLL